MVRLEIFILLKSLKALYDPKKPADNTIYADKERVYKLAEEFIRDIKVQIHQTDGIRNELGPALLFEIGTILGQIREKYRRQVDMYRQAYNKYHKISNINTPEDHDGLLGLHYVMIMEFVVSKQLEIEQLVEILLKVPKEELYQNTKPPYIPPVGANIPRLRAGEADADDVVLSQEAEQEISRLAKEEALKQRYRLQYMKRRQNKV